jgi:hypothetical protein
MLCNGVNIAEMPMKAVFIPDAGCAGGGVYKIDCFGTTNGSVRRGKLKLHLAGHIDDSA